MHYTYCPVWALQPATHYLYGMHMYTNKSNTHKCLHMYSCMYTPHIHTNKQCACVLYMIVYMYIAQTYPLGTRRLRGWKSPHEEETEHTNTHHKHMAHTHTHMYIQYQAQVFTGMYVNTHVVHVVHVASHPASPPNTHIQVGT